MNSPIQLRGAYTAIITPFKEDRSLDLPAFKNLVELQIAAGVSGLVVLGTTGEAPTVSFDELTELFSYARKVAGNRIQLILGITSNATADLVEKFKKTESLKPDGYLSAAPYYNKPSQKGIYEHFSALAQSTDRPIILYNVPGRSGVNILPETMVALTEHSNIVGVKEASGDLAQIEKLIGMISPDFSILSGSDDQNVQIIKLGGKGTISVASNAIPGVIVEICNLALAGELEKADRLDAKYQKFFGDIFIENNPHAVKTLMAHLGLCKEVFRLPMTTMLPENKKKVLESWSEISG